MYYTIFLSINDLKINVQSCLFRTVISSWASIFVRFVFIRIPLPFRLEWICVSPVCRLRGAPLVVISAGVCVCLFVSSPVRRLSQGLSGKSLQRSCCSINILHHRHPKPSHAAAAEAFLYRYRSAFPSPRRIVHLLMPFPSRSISVTLSSCLTFSIFVHCPVDLPQRGGWTLQCSRHRLTVLPGARLNHLNLTNKWGVIPDRYTYALIKWLKKVISNNFLLFKGIVHLKKDKIRQASFSVEHKSYIFEG